MPQEIYLSSSQDTAEITFSDIGGELVHGPVLNGSGNMDADPLFENTEDLKPRCYSPCVDAGTAVYACVHGFVIPAPELDINGLPRPQGEGIDMGAYDLIRCGVGITENVAPEVRITLSPNPADDHIRMDITLLSPATGLQAQIIDMNGQVRIQHPVDFPTVGVHSVEMAIRKLPPGYYLARIIGNGVQSGAAFMKR